MTERRNFGRMSGQNDRKKQKIAEKQKLEEHRCENCSHLLLNFKIAYGTIEVKCPKCGHLNKVTVGNPLTQK